jgi:hypothetical protein
MSETPVAAPAADAPLQFEHAETGAPPACAACKNALVAEYYEANGQMLCTGCRDAVVAARTGGSKAGRFFRAWGLGLAAALVGAAVYHYARELSGSDWGLIYIAVGWGVGTAVARGATGRGGWLYQAMAIGLTWLSVSWSMVPVLVDGMAQGEDAVTGALAYFIASVFALATPVLVGMESPMMILLIGFAFWECWKLNRRTELALVGPFALTPAAAVADAASAEQSVA